MPRITITISERDMKTLRWVAKAERRRPQDQAAIYVEDSLEMNEDLAAADEKSETCEEELDEEEVEKA